ncbi:hypothetical protein [Eubacterium oxidoreducens]|uniref:Uncharacterized protein n=1 Tax=Eubacterium oxidoreducens TaxID=1732 RepID=A0A1G6A0U1_EUBOX|nr:hypothetical protein SAMN02910417_00094 [Eubacterium oxidoreducens]SEI81488.1 hypothetical protein SAMN02910453_1388 [Lachnospiraceae bacterium A10]
MRNTALDAAHMVANIENEDKGGRMIKIRVQGTKEDINWLEKQIRTLRKVQVTESSEIYKNQGTKKYFRKYMEVEKETTTESK